MKKSMRLVICFVLVAISSLATLTPNVVFAKQSEEMLAKKEETVYATQKGKKYHKEDCPFIKNRDTISLGIQEAEAMGLKPCGRCRKEIE